MAIIHQQDIQYGWYIPPELDTNSLNLTLPAVNWDQIKGANSNTSDGRRRRAVTSSETSGLLQDGNLIHVAGYDRNLTVDELMQEITAVMMLNSSAEIYLFDLEGWCFQKGRDVTQTYAIYFLCYKTGLKGYILSYTYYEKVIIDL